MDSVTTADRACGAPPVRRWSTTDVDSRDALAYWCDSICHAMLELDIESARGESFRARLEQCALGPATLNFLWATSQQVMRSRDAISRARHAVFHLVHLRSGRFRMEHCGQTAELHAGDCVLVDSSEPHFVSCPQPTSCLIVQLPQDWLRAWVPAPESLLGRVLPASGGWAAALSTAVDNPPAPDTLDGLPVPAGVVAEQIATLLALAGGPVQPAPSRSEQLYVRLSRALRDRYHEIGLTPAAVATDLRMSVRYLHMLFARRADDLWRAAFEGTARARARCARRPALLGDAHRGSRRLVRVCGGEPFRALLSRAVRLGAFSLSGECSPPADRPCTLRRAYSPDAP